MRKLISFTFLSLDGYYKGYQEDTSWHQHGQEEAAFSAKNANSGSLLLFGRKTYEMMAGFWPTQGAVDTLPEMARGMNQAQKIVFSNTLQKADWVNTSIINGDITAEVKKLKETVGSNMALLGSGSVLTQLATHGLVDEFQIMINPVALGGGTPIFKDLSSRLQLKLTGTRTFESGTVLLCYQPV